MRQNQFEIVFSANINHKGVVDMNVGEGKKLSSRILGIGYTDSSSGESVLLAEVQDSVGQVSEGTQIYYLDAFAGIRADVKYTVRKGFFEQDVILREALPSPVSLGLSPATTHLEVWTEFFDPPVGTKTKVHSELNTNGAHSFNDSNYGFGNAQMGVGRAFALNDENDKSIHVKKDWITVPDDGVDRTFLIEAVEFDSVATSLQSLPKTAGSAPSLKSLPRGISRSGLVAALKQKPMEKRVIAGPKRIDFENGRLLVDVVNAKGFVLDYQFMGLFITILSRQIQPIGLQPLFTSMAHVISKVERSSNFLKVSVQLLKSKALWSETQIIFIGQLFLQRAQTTR